MEEWDGAVEETAEDGRRQSSSYKNSFCWEKLKDMTSAPAIDPVTNKATEINILSAKRPHMRAFHCSWVSFFVSFFLWFSIVPLLPYMKDSLGLSQDEIWLSNIFNLIPTERLIVGPLCDRFGPRKVFLAVLCLAAIPTACTGLVNTAGGLYALRFFIGMAGGSFVVCQFWSTIMFAPEVVGAANGFIGGWGNLGGGVTQLVIGTGLMPLFLRYMDADMAWRTISIIPAVLSIVTGIIVFFISDDYPSTSGTFKRSLVLRKTMSKRGGFEHKARVDEAFVNAAKRSASWILLLHYMFSFGIELTMLGCIGQYFTDTFGIPKDQASAVASIFGWMNIFARGAGGWMSDMADHKIGMKGRYIVHAICLAMEGVFVLVLGVSDSFAGALTIMIFFSIAVQASEGTTFAIVPFVDKKFPGAVSGIVSSGGNLGGLLFTSLLLIGDSTEYQLVFYVMGACCLVSVPLVFFVRVDDVADNEANRSTVGNYKCTEKNGSNGARRDIHFDDPSETRGEDYQPMVRFAVGDTVALVASHKDA